MNNKNVLITGYEGFIGNALLNEINNSFINSFDELFLFEKKDIDKDFIWISHLKKLVEKANIIIHIGAESSTQNSNFNYVMFQNFYFSKILFDLVGESETKVIYSSSASCYGTNGLPSTIYGWSKYLAEQYGYVKIKNFYALRYFNVYGPGENKKGKMASVANQAMNSNIRPFKLFPGKPERDFVYIDDVVSANLFPIFNEIKSGVYDVGSGQKNSFEKVLDLLEIEYEYYENSLIPDNYQFHTLASKDKFMTNWSPKYNLEQGIKAYKELYDFK